MGEAAMARWLRGLGIGAGALLLGAAILAGWGLQARPAPRALPPGLIALSSAEGAARLGGAEAAHSTQRPCKRISFPSN